MIGEVIAMLRVTIDRFEEAHEAALVAGERVGNEFMAMEHSVWHALAKAEESAQGGKGAADAVFRTGPSVALGRQIHEASLAIEEAIQEMRRKLDAAHNDVDTISNLVLSVVESCNTYIALIQEQ